MLNSLFSANIYQRFFFHLVEINHISKYFRILYLYLIYNLYCSNDLRDDVYYIRFRNLWMINDRGSMKNKGKNFYFRMPCQR